MLVAVGVHCGQLRCHVPQYPRAPLAPALPAALAVADRARLTPLLADLRYIVLYDFFLISFHKQPLFFLDFG